MLEGLDQIDWAKLDAPDVPKWLRDLASPDDKSRVDAYYPLEQKLTCEGSYSHENYGPPSQILKNDRLRLVAPFLIELLTIDDLKSKAFLLQLLLDFAVIARIYSEELYKTRVSEIAAAVRQGIPVYRRLLADKSVAVKSAAAELLYELDETI